MRTLNVLLAILISLLFGALVLEAGLRLIGRGPTPSIHRFDPLTGWSKEPGATGRRKTPEFDVRYEINALGLRDPDNTEYAKPAGTYRVVCLGDSFTLGYTVDEQDLFVEQLGRAWAGEGRKVDLVNGGTEGWSTDQEVAWFQSEGVRFDPDLVLIFPYENDLYWNGETHYASSPKPRFTPEGVLEARPLVDPGPSPWHHRFALGKLFQRAGKDPSGVHEVPFEDTKFSLGSGKKDEAPVEKRPGLLPREWASLMLEPPDFLQQAIARSRGALTALRATCAERSIPLVLVPIPSKAAIQQGARGDLAAAVCLRETLWHPLQPVRTFLGLAHELGIPTLDPTETLRGVARTPEHLPGESGDPSEPAPELYFRGDWHFNARGNLEFARFLHTELEALDVGLPRAAGPPATFAPATASSGPRKWMFVFAGLWIALTALYYGNYRDEPKWQPPLKVLGMLTAIFLIFFGIRAGMGLVPPHMASKLVIVFVAGVLLFVLWKLGRRLATIAELTWAFALRGHWYLMPLLVVLLSIGSLLVVAASSPLVAPFIYTLF